MSQWINGIKLLKDGTVMFAKAWSKLGKLNATEKAIILERFRDAPSGARAVVKRAMEIRDINSALPATEQVILKGKVGADEILHARAAASINAGKVVKTEREGVEAARKALSGDPLQELEGLRDSKMDILRGPEAPYTAPKSRAKIINISDQIREDSWAERRLRMSADAVDAQFARDFENLKLEEGVRTPLSIDINALHDKPVTETNRFKRTLADIRARAKLQQLRDAERASLEESAQVIRSEVQQRFDEFGHRVPLTIDADAVTRQANRRAHNRWRDQHLGTGEHDVDIAGAARMEAQATGQIPDRTPETMRRRGFQKVLGAVKDEVSTPLGMVATGATAAALAPSVASWLHDPREKTGVLDELMGSSEQKAVADAFRDRESILTAKMKVERLQQGMAANAARIASIRPDLYNQILYKRQLPRGAVPIGGSPDNAFLNQITLAMASGSLEPPATAEQQFLMR